MTSLHDGAWTREKARATECFRRGEWDLAVDLYVRAAGLLVDSWDLESDKGVNRILYGSAAGPSLPEVCAARAEVAKLMGNASLCLLRDGKAALALLSADRAVEAGPTVATFHARRGAALMAMHQYREAALAFALALDRASGPECVAEYAALKSKADEMARSAEHGNAVFG